MERPRELSGTTTEAVSLHPATDVGTVTLKVANLRRSLDFYGRLIGLRILEQEQQTVWLGAGSRRILKLVEAPDARPQPPNTTGLFHAAILFPDRRSLAIKVAQLAEAGVSLGQGDHVVSEAFYLSDPDGNGLELYRDRPRSEWDWTDGHVRMATDPVDVDSLFAEIPDDEAVRGNPEAAEGTKLGHMHLRVADVGLAEKFYHDVLGFDVTARWHGASFLSAGGYHHHIGLNSWQSRGAKPPVEPSAGLAEFSLALPNREEIDRLTRRIEAAGIATQVDADGSVVVRDPSENGIRLTLGEDAATRT